MSERVDEIIAGIKALPKGNVNWEQVREWLDGHFTAALAQAKREREGYKQLADDYWDQLAEINHERNLFRDERDAAQAEVERLKGIIAKDTPPSEHVRAATRRAEQAEAALARVRAALDREHICVMEACCNDAVRAALEGR